MKYNQFGNCKRADIGSDRNSRPLICKDENGDFIIKRISHNWKINSYVTNQMAKVFFPDNIISDVQILETDKAKKILLTRINEGFIPFERTALEVNQKADFLTPQTPYEWKYNVGGYNVTVSDNENISYQNNDSAKTFYNGKPVKGFYDAFAFTRLICDQDAQVGNNFALIEKEDAYFVTRYDFDDSLKFFDVLRLAKFQMNIPDSLKDFTKSVGIKNNKEFSKFMRSKLEKEVFSASAGFFGSGIDYRDLDKSQLVDAIEKLEENFDSFMVAVDEAYKKVGGIYSEKGLRKVYKINKLDCHKQENQGKRNSDTVQNRDLDKFCTYDSDLSVVDKIKEYTKFFLRKRMDELSKSKMCLEMPFDTSKDLSEEKEAILEKHGYHKRSVKDILIYVNDDYNVAFCNALMSGQHVVIPVDDKFLSGEYDHFFV